MAACSAPGGMVAGVAPGGVTSRSAPGGVAAGAECCWGWKRPHWASLAEVVAGQLSVGHELGIVYEQRLLPAETPQQVSLQRVHPLEQVIALGTRICHPLLVMTWLGEAAVAVLIAVVADPSSSTAMAVSLLVAIVVVVRSSLARIVVVVIG